MAPTCHVIVTLRLPGSELSKFDFRGHRSPFSKKAKKRPASSPASRAKTESREPDDEKPSSMPASISADPVLGALPRSLKAAPVANTSGLSLDKTPCRKWNSQLVELKMISGYTINVRAWTSEYTEAELRQKEKIEETEELPEALETNKGTTKERKLLPKKAVKRNTSNNAPRQTEFIAEEPGKKRESESQPELKIKLRKLAPLDPNRPVSEDDFDESEVSEPNSEAPSEAPSEPIGEPYSEASTPASHI